MSAATGWMRVIVISVIVVSACSDDVEPGLDARLDLGGEEIRTDSGDGGPEDAGVDSADLRVPDLPPPDGAPLPLPGCPSGCGAQQVCLAGQCESVGPSKPCGSDTYGGGLPPPEKVLHVDGSHTGSEKGSPGEPFRTISAALAALPAVGDVTTIAVAAGTYTEALKIDAGLWPPSSVDVQLRCRCPSMVMITGAIDIAPGSAALSVTIDGCTISKPGFHSQKPTWSVCSGEGDPVGLAAGGSGQVALLVRDSEISGWCTGVRFAASSSDSAAALCVARSRLFANVRGVDIVSAPTIALAPAAECAGLAEGAALKLGRIDQNKDFGVYSRIGAEGVALSGNIVEKSGHLGGETGLGYGIFLADTDSAHLSGNLVTGSYNRAIAMRNGSVPAPSAIEIRDNALIDNLGAGIALHALDGAKALTVIGNLVRSTGGGQAQSDGDGIQACVADGVGFDVTIVQNTIESSHRNGVLLERAGGTVDVNTISGSGNYGVFLQQSGASVGSNSNVGNGVGDVFNATTPVLQCASLPVPMP